MSKSSTDPNRARASSRYPSARSSNPPSPGSAAAAGSPRTGNASAERRSPSCASPPSASCYAIGAHLAVQASTIVHRHINHGVLGGSQAIAQREQTRRLRRDPPTENDMRNAIERATVSATRIEIVLSESIVAEEQDRVLTLPWTRTSSRRRREIIQRVGEAQQPLRAMRTKARDGFIKALRDAHRWLDELLYDPTQTIESLAIREGKSERSIRMTLSLAFMSPALAEAAMEGRLPRGFCIRRLTDLPMLWSEQWRAIGLQAPAQVRAELSWS